MSQENVEIVQRIYDRGLLAGDPALLLDLMGPDVRVRQPAGSRGARNPQGREEVATGTDGARGL